jgi:hypothetical protein
MKLASFTLLAALVLAGLSGCAGPHVCSMQPPCPDQQQPAGGRCGGCRDNCPTPATPGPPTGEVTYPYYTLHGPRDFLDANPRGLGP